MFIINSDFVTLLVTTYRLVSLLLASAYDPPLKIGSNLPPLPWQVVI